MKVTRAHGARGKLVLESVQRIYPLDRGGTLLLTTGRRECAFEQPGDGPAEGRERQRAGRLRHAERGGMRAIGETGFGDRPLERHLAIGVYTRERMSALEQQMEDQHGESESIVVLGAVQAAECLALQFRRREQRRPHVAGEGAAPIANLDGIAVDENRSAVFADQRIAVVHVADHVPCGVDLPESPRQVGCGADHETKVRVRKSAAAALRAVEPVRVLTRADAPHEKAAHATALVRQQIDGPGRHANQAGRIAANHELELFRFGSVGRLQIDLRHELRRANDGMHRAFAAAAQQLSQVDGGARRCAMQAQVTALSLVWRVHAFSSGRAISLREGNGARRVTTLEDLIGLGLLGRRRRRLSGFGSRDFDSPGVGRGSVVRAVRRELPHACIFRPAFRLELSLPLAHCGEALRFEAVCFARRWLASWRARS